MDNADGDLKEKEEARQVLLQDPKFEKEMPMRDLIDNIRIQIEGKGFWSTR